EAFAKSWAQPDAAHVLTTLLSRPEAAGLTDRVRGVLAALPDTVLGAARTQHRTLVSLLTSLGLDSVASGLTEYIAGLFSGLASNGKIDPSVFSFIAGALNSAISNVSVTGAVTGINTLKNHPTPTPVTASQPPTLTTTPTGLGEPTPPGSQEQTPLPVPSSAPGTDEPDGGRVTSHATTDENDHHPREQERKNTTNPQHTDNPTPRTSPSPHPTPSTPSTPSTAGRPVATGGPDALHISHTATTTPTPASPPAQPPTSAVHSPGPAPTSTHATGINGETPTGTNQPAQSSSTTPTTAITAASGNSPAPRTRTPHTPDPARPATSSPNPQQNAHSGAQNTSNQAQKPDSVTPNRGPDTQSGRNHHTAPDPDRSDRSEVTSEAHTPAGPHPRTETTPTEPTPRQTDKATPALTRPAPHTTHQNPQNNPTATPNTATNQTTQHTPPQTPTRSTTATSGQPGTPAPAGQQETATTADHTGPNDEPARRTGQTNQLTRNTDLYHSVNNALAAIPTGNATARPHLTEEEVTNLHEEANRKYGPRLPTNTHDLASTLTDIYLTGQPTTLPGGYRNHGLHALLIDELLPHFAEQYAKKQTDGRIGTPPTTVQTTFTLPGPGKNKITIGFGDYLRDRELKDVAISGYSLLQLVRMGWHIDDSSKLKRPAVDLMARFAGNQQTLLEMAVDGSLTREGYIDLLHPDDRKLLEKFNSAKPSGEKLWHPKARKGKDVYDILIRIDIPEYTPPVKEIRRGNRHIADHMLFELFHNCGWDIPTEGKWVFLRDRALRLVAEHAGGISGSSVVLGGAGPGPSSLAAAAGLAAASAAGRGAGLDGEVSEGDAGQSNHSDAGSPVGSSVGVDVGAEPVGVVGGTGAGPVGDDYLVSGAGQLPVDADWADLGPAGLMDVGAGSGDVGIAGVGSVGGGWLGALNGLLDRYEGPVRDGELAGVLALGLGDRTVEAATVIVAWRQTGAFVAAVGLGPMSYQEILAAVNRNRALVVDGQGPEVLWTHADYLR
ncbi:hypothetical protein ACFWBV_35430, partial [Streptomyces sp. NPDC060030]|uniref:hypothetical protein n=1 Tax=Streptomyces sp. NPDC060030 TaxID=3347042 RepID=UPI0036895FAC